MSMTDDSELPPALGIAAQLQARNAEYNLDLTGRVTHLGEKGLITTFPVEIPAGTVLFSIIDLRAINSTVRGLIRVQSQSESSDLGGFRTVADFVDLNADERRKILRLLGRAEDLERQAHGADPAGGQGQGRGGARRALAAESVRLGRPRITFESAIWFVLGVIFYSLVLLAIVAIFPQGRAIEIQWFNKIAHALVHTWPGLKQLFGSK